MAAHPSGSWKLSAMSVTLDSVHTMSVSVIVISMRPQMASGVGAHLVASGIHHLWRFWSQAEYGLARLPTARVFELHPV